MQVSKISFNPNFTAKKKNSSITAGTAALIILATPVAAQTPEDFFDKRLEKTHVMAPQCFIYGVAKGENKSAKQKFAEIDSIGYRDSLLTKYEVINAEREYYKTHYRKELSSVRERYTTELFDRLANAFNKDNDNKSISFSEYLDIMKAYKESRE